MTPNTVASYAPSAALLRALSRPSALSIPTCSQCQTRSVSTKFANFTPRHKYAKVNRLDKLHRQQKAAALKEKEDSQARAKLLEETLSTSVSKVDAESMPFRIDRTRTKNLPIYETTKNGGSRQITQIRKLSGDLREMQKQLQSVLQLPEVTVDKRGRKTEPISINHLTQQIIIKGWRAPEVKTWAGMVGF